MNKYSIFKEHELVLMKYGGRVDIDTILDMNRQMVADDDYFVGINGIADYRGVDVALSVRDVAEIARHVKDSNKISGNWAIVVDKPFSTALANLYRNKMKQCYPHGVFCSLDAAFKYLDINRKDFNLKGLY